MKACLKCGSADVHRSRHRSLMENWRKAITGKRPYRCRACGARMWAADAGQQFSARDQEIAARAMAPEPPDLAAPLVIEGIEPPDIDLTQLDLPETPQPIRKSRVRKPASPK
jgi:hypothetical protein